MRHRSESTSPSSSPLDNVFSPPTLPVCATGMRSSPPVRPSTPDPGSANRCPTSRGPSPSSALGNLERGDVPEAILWQEETALLLAAILPLVAREMLFHISEEEEADGYPITAVYGEQGAQVAGWLRRFEPALAGALHLAEALVRTPSALAKLLQASGGGATEQIGCILARDGMK
jgi:hypothetical protein